MYHLAAILSFFSVCSSDAANPPAESDAVWSLEGSKTTFKLAYWAAVNDVQHGLGGSTDARWVVGVAPLMETGAHRPAPERKRFRMHHCRLGRLAPDTGTVGSSMIS